MGDHHVQQFSAQENIVMKVTTEIYKNQNSELFLELCFNAGAMRRCGIKLESTGMCHESHVQRTGAFLLKLSLATVLRSWTSNSEERVAGRMEIFNILEVSCDFGTSGSPL